MLNENLLATIIALLAVCIAYLGLDNGDMIRLVISAYLGYLTGQRMQKKKTEKYELGTLQPKVKPLP